MYPSDRNRRDRASFTFERLQMYIQEKEEKYLENGMNERYFGT